VLGGAVTVWTGRQILMWGGGCCGDDVAFGAAYTPATETWQRLPASPLAGRQRTVGAWTGTELIIVGGSTADGKVLRDAAAYNPATRSWRHLPALSEPCGGATATWDGSEVLVIGGRGGDWQHAYADGVAYNPATNRWRRLPAMEGGRMDHTAVWTGRYLLVWGGRTIRAGSWTAPARGLAYDPASNRWSALPRSPLRGRVGHVAVWTGTQMLIWGSYPARRTDPERPFTDGAAYTPSPM
jgi:N-acetylneuraminic acid mutarotase